MQIFCHKIATILLQNQKQNLRSNFQYNYMARLCVDRTFWKVLKNASQMHTMRRYTTTCVTYGRYTEGMKNIGLTEKLNSFKSVEDVQADTLTKEILKSVKQSANIYTDEWLGYKDIHKFYNHEIVNHGAREFVNGNAYTNNMECFWGILKRGIIGIYHFTCKKHLQKYLDEFVFRFNTRYNYIKSN